MNNQHNSPNFRDGVFQNLVYTPMMAEGVSTFGVLRDFLNKPKLVTPPAPIPNMVTDLGNLQSDKPTLIWFGHSSYLVNINGINLLIDPVFSGAASPVPFFIKAFAGSNTYGPQNMPPIDYIILTHNHYDHLDKKTIAALAGQTRGFIVPLGVEAHLNSWKVPASKIRSMDWWQSAEIAPGIHITSMPSRHFSGRGIKRGGSLWTAYLLDIFGYTIFIGGDSGYGDHFVEIGKEAGKIDLAILECGQYNEAWPFIHMLPEEVVQAHIDLGAKTLLPVHWGKFALAYHNWDDPIERVTAKAAREGIHITTPMMVNRWSSIKNILTANGGVLYIDVAMRKNTKQLLDDMVEAMQFHKDAANAGPMASYMKNKFAFLGIRQPLRKELSAEFIKTSRTLEGQEIIALCNALWKLPEREYQLIALELLYSSRKQWNEEFLLFFNTIVERKAWWDTIDFIATKLYGGYFTGTKRPAQMLQWSKSADIWQNRVAILFQLNYKDNTDQELLFEVIERLKGNKEFFIQKAIGWSLRQYYRTQPVVVEKFVTTAGLNGLARREALKHA